MSEFESQKIQLIPFTPPTEWEAQGERLGIKILISSDRLRAYLSLASPQHPQTIGEFLEKCGIKSPLLLEALHDPKVMTEVILQHKPYLFADNTMFLTPVPDVDFHELTPVFNEYIRKRFLEGAEKARLAFTNVRAGQVVFTRFPVEQLEELEATRDVFGTLRAEKRTLIKIKLGSGLVENEDGSVQALENGYLDFNDSAVQVHNKLIIRTLSDWSREALDFVGAVEIGQNVIANFDVKAEGSIVLEGSLEEASLESGDTITLGGGIIGKPEGHTSVKAKTLIKGRYVNNATVFCEHDIELPKGSYHSTIHCYGKLTIEGGPVVGGQAYGANGVLANELGGSSGVKTFVGAGFCTPIPMSLDQLINEREIKKVDMAEWIEKVKPILAAKAQPGGLSDRALAQLKEMLDTITSIKRRIEELGAWIDSHDREACEMARIEVKGEIFPGVTIMINNVSALIQEKMSRVSFRFDPASNAIRARKLK